MGIFRAVVTVAIAAGLVTAWKLVPVTALPHPLASAATQITYYVSPTGNDRATGTSPSHPWRTLARASAARLRPGNRLLLRGRHVYQGSLWIGKSDSGTSARRVRIGSYGGGRATIWSPSSGVLVLDAANVTISDLIIVGRRAMRPGTAGIQLYSDLTRRRLRHVVIQRVDVSGFGYGIAIGAAHNGAGFSDVWIKQSASHGNLDAGVATYGPKFNPAAPSYANAGVHIWRMRVFGNRGDPADVRNNSGSGIVLSSVNGATVTMSSAYDNGGRGGARAEGPEGIWAYDASHVVMEHDVAHDNWSKSKEDGGGFGFDQGTSDSVIEYNLSYRNHGPGYLLYGSPRIPQNGNVVRFNISYQDGRGHYVLGGIAIGGLTINLTLYQNTVVMAKASSQATLKLYGHSHGDRVLNNIFVGSSNGLLVYAIHPTTTSDVLLAGNDYLSPAGHGQWQIKWAGTLYDSRATWRAGTGQEMVRGRPTGLDVSPRFVNPDPARSGGAGFALGRASALRRAGLDLVRLFGVRPGTITFGGQPYRTGRPNVGAQ